MNAVTEKMRQCGIIPVIVIENAEDALPLGKALLEAGLTCAEITFRTDAAIPAIRLLHQEYPGLLIGAGTVLTKKQADEAVRFGAQFIVTPGLNPLVVSHVQKKGIPVFPGVFTPTEVETAMSYGLKDLKFFPAEAGGGVKMLKALNGPYPNIRFMPTGGISADNVKDYLSLDNVFCVGGSWIAKKEMIREKQFDGIRKLAEEASLLVKEIRNG